MLWKRTRLSIALSVALPCVSVVPGIAQVQQPTTIAFVNVNVIPLDSDRIQPRQTVLIRGDRILAIGGTDSVQVPTNATVIDGGDQYLLPGLTDAHVHLPTGLPWAPARDDFGDAALYLAYGVTTVVNMGGTPAQLEWRKNIANGTLLGPTIYTAGPFVNEPRVITPDEVERDIVAQAQKGYDLIKFHELRGTTTGLSRPAYHRMLETARRLGIPLIGHAPRNLGLGELLHGRQSLAHSGELSNMYFLPSPALLLLTLGAFVALLLLALSWVIARVGRSMLKRAQPLPPSMRVFRKMSYWIILGTSGGLVCAAMFFPGGPFFGSTILRLMFTSLVSVVVIVTAQSIRVSVRMLHGGTVPLFGRVQSSVTTAVAIILASALLILVPFAWRSSDPGIDRFTRRIYTSGMYVQSTLVVYATLNTTTRTALIEDSAIDYLLPSTRDSWRRLATPPVSFSYLGFMQKVVHSLHGHGVPIMVGTDAMGIPLVTPGSSLHRELELLGASGLTNYDVIRSATVVPAKFLKKQNEFGTVAMGQRADLLLVRGNPLDNLAVLRQPTGVMVRGKWLPREELDALLRRLGSN